MSTASALEHELEKAVSAASARGWALSRSWKEGECLCLGVEARLPPDNVPVAVILEVRAARPDVRAFRTLGGLSLGYRGRDLPGGQYELLEKVLTALARVLSDRGFDPSRDALPNATANDAPAFPTPYQRAHLERETPLDASVIDAFRRDGHVLVRRAFDRHVVLAAAPHLVAALERAWPRDLPPVEERPDAYSQSFTQITDIGYGDDIVRAFSQARRIVRMAADLMGVERVRLFCEDWLIKEPGARITPWHQDEAVFPFDARQTVTCWIPIQDVRRGSGLLRFARGSHLVGLADVEDINDVSEAEFNRIIAEHGFGIDELEPIFAGDVSFHHGRLIHGAFANTSDKPRAALALHCFADGALFKKATTPKMARLLSTAAPGAAPGEPAESDRWPLVYDAAAPRPARARRGASPAFHLRATLLPAGDKPMDLWVDQGRLWFEPVEGAEELTLPGEFVTCGLVDCHAHISYPHEPSDPVETQAWTNARRAEYAPTGVLLLRDMGAVGDEICELGDVPGLPRVQVSGNMIMRYDEWPFTRTEPSELVQSCRTRIERGGSWVKIFADWSSDYRGRVNTGFTGHDEVTYPLPVLTEAVAAVHALGGRVAAHCFTRPGAEVAIRAGVDSLEHGWGVDDELVEEMAARGIAWAPLVGIAVHMWRIARRDNEPDRMEWVEQAMALLSRCLPLAEERGVTILAGTDMFPQVTVDDEIRQLVELGVSASTALAGGSWKAREWLGEPALEQGAPADLVVYSSDPRLDLACLSGPRLVLAAGKLVGASFSGVRPRYVPWSSREET